jgi:hypothetical protein
MQEVNAKGQEEGWIGESEDGRCSGDKTTVALFDLRLKLKNQTILHKQFTYPF